MVDKIIWQNVKSYDHKTIIQRINFVEKNMNGLLPLYGQECESLKKYSKKHNLPPYEMICLRNTIKIQKEINASKYFAQSINKILKNFTNTDPNSLDIVSFLKSTKMPIGHVIKILKNKELSKHNLDKITKIKKMIVLNEQNIMHKSIEFEYMLENYLQNKNIKFQTETDIKKSGNYTVTPDILLDEPIIIQVDGTDHIVKWMDAKNYIMVDVPFIMKSLNKQAKKYNDVFGMGAFVFHYGFDNSLHIPGTIILDGSVIEQSL